MANLNPLVYTAAEYKLVLLYNASAYPLLTVSDFGADVKVEDETIYAIGQNDPIAEKTNGEQITGKFTIQAGELANILNTQGLATAARIRGAVLAISTIDGLINKVYGGVNITSEGSSVKAKDKNTPVELNYKAVNITSNGSPLSSAASLARNLL